MYLSASPLKKAREYRTLESRRRKIRVLETDRCDRTRLIRSIQKAEGNPQCFLTGVTHCTEEDCAWRPYCIGDK